MTKVQGRHRLFCQKEKKTRRDPCRPPRPLAHVHAAARQVAVSGRSHVVPLEPACSTSPPRAAARRGAAARLGAAGARVTGPGQQLAVGAAGARIAYLSRKIRRAGMEATGSTGEGGSSPPYGSAHVKNPGLKKYRNVLSYIWPTRYISVPNSSPTRKFGKPYPVRGFLGSSRPRSVVSRPPHVLCGRNNDTVSRSPARRRLRLSGLPDSGLPGGRR